MYNNKRRHIVKTLLALSMLTFIVGFAVRSVSSITYTVTPLWLEGILGILMGLFLLFTTAAIFYGTFAGHARVLLRVVGLIVSMILLLGAVVAFLSGAFWLLASLPWRP